MGYDIDECAICYLNGYGNNPVEEYQTIGLCVICFGKAVGMRTGGSSMRRIGRLPSEFNQDRSFQDVNCYCNRHDDTYQLGFVFPCCSSCEERIMAEIDEELGPPSPTTSDDEDDVEDDDDDEVDDNDDDEDDDGDIGGDHEDDLVVTPVIEPISSETE